MDVVYALASYVWLAHEPDGGNALNAEDGSQFEVTKRESYSVRIRSVLDYVLRTIEFRCPASSERQGLSPLR